MTNHGGHSDQLPSAGCRATATSITRARKPTLPGLLRRRFLAALGVVLAVAAGAAQAQVAPFATQPFTIVVPYTPGSGADIIARSVAPPMSRRLGQPVVVENKPGASGTIAMAVVARSAADGHTLLMAADSLAMTPSLYRKLAALPHKDLSAIGRAAVGSMALVVHPSVQVSSVAELVALARSEPGRLTYATPGAASPHHALMELFKQSTATDLLHVPYKGMAGAVTDLVGGHVQVGVMSLQVALPHVGAGRLRLLAVADSTRVAAAPLVPTFREAGYPELSHANWFGLFAPAATPASAIGRLNAALLEALAQKSTLDTLQAQGLAVSASSPADFAQQVQQDVERWSQVVSKAGIKAD